MSSPVYELLKRPDELFVVEHAHLQPRFVEDSVRIALAGDARALSPPGRRRLSLLAAAQPRDDPLARRARRALRHRRRAARRARGDAARGTTRSSRNGCVVTETLTPTRKPADSDTGSAARQAVERDRAERQPQHVPGRRLRALVDASGRRLRRGHALANRIHNTGRAVVWRGHKEARSCTGSASVRRA